MTQCTAFECVQLIGSGEYTSEWLFNFTGKVYVRMRISSSMDGPEGWVKKRKDYVERRKYNNRDFRKKVSSITRAIKQSVGQKGI